ncbi:hypothetical protein [Nocardia sp. NPDC051750]|uniref:hypothetical protein n=1 Tax=Nocardia sp. NPDC051750 TaxID=3364325 RepID=UPI00378A7F86
MTEFVLTQERRAELGSLLDDESKFQADYPKVADYLTMAPGLSGTGDEGVDRAFDVRLLHFMTGGESANPYWDIVGPLVNVGPPERGGRREVNGGQSNGSARLAYAQMLLQEAYAYAIPSPATVSWIATACDGTGVIELGAGRGYWAQLLSDSGLDVLAFDSEPPGAAQNVSFPDASGVRDTWHAVDGLDDFDRVAEAGELSRRTLFLCWPPGWGDAMSHEALARYAAAGGRRVIYVGEPKGGKTGSDEYFDMLDREWRLEDRDQSFVSWWNLNDRAELWVPRT